MQYRWGALAVIGAAVLWSLDGLLRRDLYSLSPTLVVFWEHVFGALILAPFILKSWKKFRQLTRKQWLMIILVALLSGTVGTILYTAALGKVFYIQFSVVVLLQQTQPLFAIIAARLLLREKLTPRFFVLAGVALVAVYFISFPQLTVAGTGRAAIIAAVMALGAAIAWGTSTAFSKYSLRNTSVTHVTWLRFAFTGVFAGLVSLFFVPVREYVQLELAQWQAILTITLSTGLVALLLYYFGLKRIPASHSTLFELAWPLSAVCIGYVAFDERLTITQIVGAILLVIVMCTLSYQQRSLTPPLVQPEP